MEADAPIKLACACVRQRPSDRNIICGELLLCLLEASG